MKRALAIVAFCVVFASQVAADEPGLPRLTKDTLIGTWEAVSPYNPFVFRLEIAAHSPSYLVWMWDSHPIMCRLVSSRVHGGRVMLRFRPMRNNDIDFDDLTISGAGYGDATSGTLTGTLRIRRPIRDDYVEAIAFSRPPWIRWLPPYAKRSEELMRRARREVN
jgi:hypothetical protein